MQQIWSATGRRKRASAQVRIASPGTGTIQINQVDAQVYLQGKYPTILKPLQLLSLKKNVMFLFKQQVGVLQGKLMRFALAVHVHFVLWIKHTVLN